MTQDSGSPARPVGEEETTAMVTRLAVRGGSRVLDLGSGPDRLSTDLLRQHGRSVTCVDRDPAVVESLARAGFEAVQADVESAGWAAALGAGPYDVVILPDVLQHLRDPATVLDTMLSESILAPDGFTVVSVPNAAHESVVAELLVGDLRDSAPGILDDGQLRWFTLAGLTRLLETSGYLVDRVERTTTPGETPAHDRAHLLPESLRRAARELNGEATTARFVVMARPDDAAGRIALERAAHDDERRAWAAERDELLRSRRELEAEVARLRQLLTSEREAASAELALGSEELGRLRDREQRVGPDFDLYASSRGVRAAARLVRGMRQLRSRMHA